MNERDTNYALLAKQVEQLIDGESDRIANLANTSALLYHNVANINWLGFYLLHGSELVLGPFQGKPACVRIPVGKGVCGTAAQRRETIVVDNVHEFDGHIACDMASNSEIVVPLIVDGQLLGVLDVDSPQFNRFTPSDRDGLEAVMQVLETGLRVGA